jgi:hypothetical protein
LKKLALVSFIAVVLTGCFSVGHTVVIESAKPYEGHYMTVDDFRKGTETIQLQKGESIWVLSNSTLKRLLKNTEK